MKTPSHLARQPEFSVAYTLEAIPARLKGGVVAVGNFDGVHRGHQAILRKACTLAAEDGLSASVLTFSPHPRTFFQPEKPVAILTPQDNKIQLLAANRMDGVVILPFNAALASQSAEDFVSNVLVGAFQAKHVVVGYDFHFGQARRGTPEFLVERGKELGFDVTIMQPEGGTEPYSSSLARNYLLEGNIEAASAVLGYRWFAQGEVVHGEKRGRELGFPTANIALPEPVPLRHGIYAVQAMVEDTHYNGVASFGRRPTFDNGAPLLEVYLFDASPDLYGRIMQVTFITFIRDELRFDTLEDLIARMHTDCEEARVALRKAGTTPIPEGIANR